MKRFWLVTGCIVALLLIVTAFVYFRPSPISPSVKDSQAASAGEAVEPAPPLGPEYTNNTYHFSLRMPTDFKTQEQQNQDDTGAPAPGTVVLLQNTKGEGIQILVTPYPSDTHVITADDVRGSIPDMKVTDDQEVDIGTDYKGVAFKSDNDAFGGASREVWFVFHKNLYQISTYARLDPLLKAMFATWKFF